MDKEEQALSSNYRRLRPRLRRRRDGTRGVYFCNANAAGRDSCNTHSTWRMPRSGAAMRTLCHGSLSARRCSLRSRQTACRLECWLP